jgi:hypothetical protein
MTQIEKTDWQESGNAPMTRKQQKMLNAACGDLAEQMRWHGIILGKDDWRHFLSAVVLGERILPGYKDGLGDPPMIRISRSSLELNKTQATQAIRTAFDIGDNPKDQGLDVRPVRWCEVITLARYISEDEPL